MQAGFTYRTVKTATIMPKLPEARLAYHEGENLRRLASTLVLEG